VWALRRVRSGTWVLHYCWSVYKTLDLDGPLGWWTVVRGAVLRRLGVVDLQTELL